MDFAEGLLSERQEEVAGFDAKGAIVEHKVGFSRGAIAYGEKRSLHRLRIGGQSGEILHDEEFVVEQFRPQCVGAHVLQRHAVRLMAARV